MTGGTDLQARFAAALGHLRAGDLAAAEELCRYLAASLPGDAGVLQLQAAIALQQGDAAEAERLAAASLEARPGVAATLMIAGRAARAQGAPDRAAGHFDHAAALDAGRADAAFLACLARLDAGELIDGARIATLLERFPDYAPGWLELAGYLERAGQEEAALVAYGRVLRAMPDHVQAWFKTGLLRQDRRDFAGAAEAYREVLSRRPDLAEAETNLGIVLQETGDLDGAKACYGRALRLNPASFGRIAQALTAAPKGELWLEPERLRRTLASAG